MGKRDIVAEILSKKSRTYINTKRWDKVSAQLDGVREAANLLMALTNEGEIVIQDVHDVNRARSELDQYIPIRCVACIEGYFRLAYTDLIEFGNPFRSNAAKFDQIKFSIDIALSLQSNSVSIGEFIAHLLPLSSFEDINSTMSKLMGQDFTDSLRHIRSQVLTQPNFADIDPFAELIRQTKYIFELRHIYCHELSTITESKSRFACSILRSNCYRISLAVRNIYQELTSKTCQPCWIVPTLKPTPSPILLQQCCSFG